MSTPPHRQLKILLVEDHPDTRQLLRVALERRGHEVLVAGTVAEGLKTLTDTPPDVLISDIGLPDGNGWELLRNAPSPPPMAIAMSGFGCLEDRARSQAAGYLSHLIKPFKIAELNLILDKALPQPG